VLCIKTLTQLLRPGDQLLHELVLDRRLTYTRSTEMQTWPELK
jgi:hypothetical protein